MYLKVIPHGFNVHPLLYLKGSVLMCECEDAGNYVAVCTCACMWMSTGKVSRMYLSSFLECATALQLLHWHWDLNSCPHACITELSPKLFLFESFSGFSISFGCGCFLLTKNKHLPDVSMIDEEHALITSLMLAELANDPAIQAQRSPLWI